MIGYFYISKNIPVYTTTCPLAGSRTRRMVLGSVSPIAAKAVTLPAAELLFAIAETDEFSSTVIAGQAVWCSAAELVPPLVTALVAAKSPASVTRRP